MVLSASVRSGPLFLFALAAVLLALPGVATAAVTPSQKTIAKDGPGGRYLLDGTWLTRDDSGNRGIDSKWYSRPSSAGWSRATVPNAFNANDVSNRSMGGSIVWYRKDFKRPAGGTDYLARF